MKINPDEHVFIAGRTGTGKTYLARKYLAGVENVWVLDTKGLITWPEVPKSELTVVSSIAEIRNVKTPKLIFKPNPFELEFEVYDSFFQFAYSRDNLAVWVDEVMSVSPNPARIPFWAKAILTRGRERNVSMWSLTQRPSGISQMFMSEATHFFVFDLNLPQDRSKLAEITGAGELLRLPGREARGRHNFWYYRTGQDKAVLARLKAG